MLSSSRTRSARLLGVGAVVSALAIGALGALPAQADPLDDPGSLLPGPAAPGATAPGAAAVGDATAPLPPAPQVPPVGEPLPELVPVPAAPGPASRGTAADQPTAAAHVTAQPGTTTLSVEVLVGPDGDVPCTVDADLYIPDDESLPGPYPAILTTNGFGGDKGDQAEFAEAFADRGYAVLSYTGLGFPRSTCSIYLDDREYDGKAASQLVDVLAGAGNAFLPATGEGNSTPAEPRTRVTTDAIAMDADGDPVVGMVGGSYGGQVQFAAAAIDDRIDTLVPLITWNDLQYSLAPNNTSFTRDAGSPASVTHTTPGTEKAGWSTLFFGVGIVDGLEGSARGETPGGTTCETANFRQEACDAKLQLDADGYPDQETIDFTRQVSVADYIEDIEVPVLLIQGENDTLFNLQEAIATYESLTAQGTRTQMIWQSWGHSGGGTPAPGELDFSTDEIDKTYLGRRILDWFDEQLKGEDGPVYDDFAYYRSWAFAGDANAAYTSAPSYPVGGREQLFLSGDGALVPDASDVAEGSVEWVNPTGGAPSSFSEVSAAPEQPLPPSDVPGTFGAWTTQPLASDLDVVGVPRLQVQFTSPVVEGTQKRLGPEGQLLVFAKLYDVDPEGNPTLVNRLISPTRVPDVTKPVTIELPAIVHRVEAGHRLQLVLAGSDAAYRNNELPQPVSVDSLAASDDLTLTLPTTSALALEPPTSEAGSGDGDGAAPDDGEGARQVSARSSRLGSLPRTGVEIAGLVGTGLLLAGGGYQLVRRSRRA